MASGAGPGRGARGAGGAGGGGPAMAVSPYVQAMQELFRANTRSREFPAHGAKVHSVAWSCCGRRLASGSFDKTASVFLLEKDRLVRSPGSGRAWCGSVPGALGHPGCGGLGWCPEQGVCPVVGTGPGDGYCVCSGTGAPPRTAQAGSGAAAGGDCLSGTWRGLRRVCVPAGMQRAGMCGRTGSRAGHILTSSALSLQVKENNYRGHGDSVDQLCWHPSNPDLFVTASGDKTIRIWDVRTTKCIATVNTKGEFLQATHLQWHRALDLSSGSFWLGHLC